MAGTGVVSGFDSVLLPDDEATLGFGKLLVVTNDFVGVLLVVSVVRGLRKKSLVLAWNSWKRCEAFDGDDVDGYGTTARAFVSLGIVFLAVLVMNSGLGGWSMRVDGTRETRTSEAAAFKCDDVIDGLRLTAT